MTPSDGLVEAEQTRLLLENPIDVPANLINAGLVAVVVWPLYPAWAVALWLVVACIVSLSRALLRHRYTHAAGEAKTSPNWARTFTLNAFVAGCLWGLSASVILMTPDPTYYNFIVFVLGGTMAGGVICIAVNFRAMLAFVLPTILPAIVALAVRGGLVQIEMAVMLALFTCALVWTGRSFNRSFTENIRLRFGQEALVVKLQASEVRLRSSEAAMAESQALAHVGTWVLDVESKSAVWSAETYRIFGVDPATFKPSRKASVARIHPDDAEEAEKDYDALLATGATGGIQHRIVMDDGQIKDIHELGRVIYDVKGRPVQVVGSVQDVTARRRGEAASALLAAIVDASADAIYAETLAGTIVSWNKGAERMFGYCADEAIGQNISMIIPEDRRREIERNLATLAQGKPIAPFDTERLRKDGVRVPVSIAVSLTRDASQRVVGASFITRDITERQAAADVLAYRDRLQHAVTIGTGVLVNAQSFELGMSKALRVVGEGMGVDRAYVLQALVGQAPPMVLRYSWEAGDIQRPLRSIQIPVEELQSVFAAWFESLTRGEPVLGQLATSEGPIRALFERLGTRSTLVVPLFVNGVFWGTLSAEACVQAREWKSIETDTLRTFADIGGALIQHVEAQQKLETSKARLRAVMETAQDAIITIDGAARIGLWNRAAQRILGYTAEEAVGKQVHELLAPNRFRAKADSSMDVFVGTGTGNAIGKTTELAALCKDGTEITIELSLAATRLDQGWGAIGVLRDITVRKEADNRLHFANLLLKSEMEASPLGIVVVDPSRKILLFNQKFAKMWELPPAELGNATLESTLLRSKRLLPDPAKYGARVDYLFDHPGESSREEYALTDGRIVDRNIVTLTGVSGEYLGRVVYFRDVTEERTAAAKLEFANLLLSTEMEASPNGIIVFGPDRKTLLFNRQFAEIWKVSPASLTGGTLDSALLLCSPLMVDPDKFIALMNHLFDHPSESLREEYVTSDSRIINLDIVTLTSASGDYLGRVGYFDDITERRRAEGKLAFANLLLRTQMEASLDGILIVNEDKEIVAFNQRFATIWKIALADLAAGRDAAVLAKVTSSVKDAEKFIARVHYLYDHPGEDSQDEYETTDGRSIDRYTVTLYSPSRVYLGRAWFFRDITERKRVEALVLRMARFDVLTGLANRAVFVEALQHAIATAARGEKGFAILYLDLDHFKDVNDTLGHPVGDELLRSVADRLRANTRETDTVARFGGDEFAIIVADTRDATDAAILADKLASVFAIPFSIRGSDIHIGASIGIAAYGAEGADAETLLSHADVALYRAKSEGRGGYRFFTDAMDTEVQTRVKLGAELRVAIDEGQLFLLYQPQVAIDSGRITGVEALVRWRHPKRGVLGPDLFIPIAEQIGIIGKLGHWVLWEACRQGKAWLDDGVAPVRIAVNVSALQFRTPVALEADIAAALAQTGMPAHLLELELTESVLMDASREHGDLLTRLRETGVTVAIDDFGTGYSSLDYLRRYPSNRIKIAQNFVKNLETTPGDAAIIRATIGLARELNIDVIAEGVETHVQRDLLKEWGCREVQGFLFARPLTANDAASVLRAGKLSPPQISAAKVSPKLN